MLDFLLQVSPIIFADGQGAVDDGIPRGAYGAPCVQLKLSRL
jgi:hypothetical protein